MTDAPTTLYTAAAIAGFGESTDARPGTVVAQDGQVIDAGPTDEMTRRHGSASSQTIALPDQLLIPGMVNAHAHLELTAIGPQPYAGDFTGWVNMLRDHMPPASNSSDDDNEASWYVDSAKRGAEQSLAAGVEAVGDITRFDAVAKARRNAGLAGVSFIELFGMGEPWDAEALARLARSAEGFQPHAPYSAGPRLFDAACATGVPLSCHLAETKDEAEFVAQGQGPFLNLLKKLGKWSPDFAQHYNQGQSPVQWLAPYLRKANWLVAHCNYVSDDDIALLADTDTAVAYCPIASEYFGHADHRYRDMLDAGINVCLGTDSIVCQPAQEPQPLSILAQARRLYRRDATDPAVLLNMATIHGRRALQLPSTPRILISLPIDPMDSADPWQQTLLRHEPATPLVL